MLLYHFKQIKRQIRVLDKDSKWHTIQLIYQKCSHSHEKKCVRIACLCFPTAKNSVRVRKWSHDRKWSRIANDPGPEMIPDGDHKRSRLKNKEWHGCGNGEGRELGWIAIIFIKTILNYGLQLASFCYLFHTTMLWMAPS